MIVKTTDIFGTIRNETEGMASISQEHTAATQEILATMENQNTNINNIYSLMKDLTESSVNLRSVVNNQ